MENQIQLYCISARSRNTGITECITLPMQLDEAKNYKPSTFEKKYYKYFRVSKYPFKTIIHR